MTNHTRKVLAAAAIASLVFPVVPVASAASGGLVYTVILPAGEFGSAGFAKAMVSSLAAAQKFCAELNNDAYRVDCLSERFGAIAGGIPKDSDYAEVRAALLAASDKMGDLARANRDPGLNRARAVRSGTSETTTRPLTPVRAETAASVNSQALAILEETETLLLRSSESSKSKIAQYAQIADAIGSNKVLLRA